eukprot:scaffold5935_cov137-Isochrysis_galbana.AAC.4
MAGTVPAGHRKVSESFTSDVVPLRRLGCACSQWTTGSDTANRRERACTKGREEPAAPQPRRPPESQCVCMAAENGFGGRLCGHNSLPAILIRPDASSYCTIARETRAGRARNSARQCRRQPSGAWWRGSLLRRHTESCPEWFAWGCFVLRQAMRTNTSMTWRRGCASCPNSLVCRHLGHARCCCPDAPEETDKLASTSPDPSVCPASRAVSASTTIPKRLSGASALNARLPAQHRGPVPRSVRFAHVSVGRTAWQGTSSMAGLRRPARAAAPPELSVSARRLLPRGLALHYFRRGRLLGAGDRRVPARHVRGEPAPAVVPGGMVMRHGGGWNVSCCCVRHPALGGQTIWRMCSRSLPSTPLATPLPRCALTGAAPRPVSSAHHAGVLHAPDVRPAASSQIVRPSSVEPVAKAAQAQLRSHRPRLPRERQGAPQQHAAVSRRSTAAPF